MQAVICDHCGKIFKPGGKYHIIKHKITISESACPTWHFCDECLAEFVEWASQDKQNANETVRN